jgi:hypothetical protein|tara:strand:- start:3387 stop:3524 length:138 start_codon:yes stop_codon:yes gene_type:complete
VKKESWSGGRILLSKSYLMVICERILAVWKERRDEWVELRREDES